MKPLRRLAAAAAVLAALVAPVVGATGSVHAGAAGSSRALVIVDTTCCGVHKTVISFDGSISGLDALQLAGADPVTVDYGGSLGEAVCKLYGVGDEPTPSQCPGGWLYYRAVDGASGFTQSDLGASNTRVSNGDVEGWKYGGGPPAFESFCDAVGCAPPPTAAPPPGGNSDTGAPQGGADGNGESGGATQSPSSGQTGGTTTQLTPGATTPPPVLPSTTAPRRVRPSTTTRGTGAKKHGTDQAALGVPGSRDGGGGSPWGVVVAAAVLAGGGGAAFWLRRRRTRASPG